MSWTPEAITKFLAGHMHKFDGPAQYLGTEPNVPVKDWDSSALRVLMAASWPYEQAAGNQSIPAVWKTVSDNERYLCDRWYLPSTSRDMKIIEKAGVPVFGLEHRRPLGEYDVVGTSISYIILLMNFVRYLDMSGVPIRWRDRVPEDHPMVIVGGQAFCNPEVMAPVVDCVFLGEAEDEPGNGGLRQVLLMIEMFKAEGTWQTERVECYARLARTFNYLYFPRFVDVSYAVVGRSKEMAGYRGTVTGMRLPFLKRHVTDLNAIAQLDAPPLLFTDPSMGSGDLETSRGCPAWCTFCRLCLGGETTFISRDGVRRLDECAGQEHQVWTGRGWAKAQIDQHGEDVLNTITLAPAFLGWNNFSKAYGWRKTRTDFIVTHRATELHRWPLTDGTETHHLKEGDFVRSQFVSGDDHGYDIGWVHGITFGDGTWENYPVQGERSNRYAVLVRADRPDHLRIFQNLECGVKNKRHQECAGPYCVTSIRRVSEANYRVRFSSRIRMKRWPDELCGAGYVRGFIEGWDAADGYVKFRGEDRIRIASQHAGAEEWLREHAAYGGWLLTGAYAPDEKWMDTNYGRRKGPLKQYALSRITAWKVIGIEKGDVAEPVYCATVPGSFWTLASGVYTGNTYAQKPFRQKSEQVSVDAARRFRNNVGGVEVSPFGPDFPMQTNKNALIKALLENVTDKVDTVAQRIDDFISDDTYLLLQAAGGARSITLGLEGVDQRMRDLVGKATSDAEVREAVTRGIRAGFRKFKLFMIIGLPGEDTGDVAKVVKLAQDLAAIRDSLNVEKVLFQFSFTPLLYEAQTPFQWFSCWPVPDHDLIDVADALRELRILFKIGTKAEPNKVHFFQLCQRASRDAGEAVIDVLEELGAGCWGGVPRDMIDRLEAALRAHGFDGFTDLFGERERGDMLGWEFISTGVSRDLLWDTFAKMREFALRTDSATYDSKFDERYHGNEWIDRCDERCMGNSCGVCSGDDLRLRQSYIREAAADRVVDVSRLRPVDQSTIAVRVRARLRRPEAYRWADNEFRRHLIRRAGYRVQDKLGGPCVSKHSIWFASDAHGYRDWTCGTDYVEFGITQRLPVLNGADVAWEETFAAELEPWLHVEFPWEIFPASVSMRSGAGASYHSLEILESTDKVASWLREWQDREYVPLRLKSEGSYFSAGVEEVNARDFVDDIWAVRHGTATEMRMLTRRRAGPYQVWQALSGKASWIDAAARPARTLEVFAHRDEADGGLACIECGWSIPESLIGVAYHEDYCPRCADEQAGIVLAGLDRGDGMTERHEWMEMLENQLMVRVTNPGNGSAWTGWVAAVTDTPGIVLRTLEGDKVNLPQAFDVATVAPARPANAENWDNLGSITGTQEDGLRMQPVSICGCPNPRSDRGFAMLCRFAPHPPNTEHSWTPRAEPEYGDEYAQLRAAVGLRRRHCRHFCPCTGSCQHGCCLPKQHQEQAAPVPNDGPSMHDMVIRDILSREPRWDLSVGTARHIRDRVADDLLARKQLGLDRYGSLLQAHNGRDALRDLYEELQDAAAYARTRLAEIDESSLEYLVLFDVYDSVVSHLVTVRRLRDAATE